MERVGALLRESRDSDSGRYGESPTKVWVEEVLSDALALDEDAIGAKMVSDAATMGVRRFLRERAAPLIEELGEAWARGAIGVRHEHLVTEILESRLRALRIPLDASATGRPVVLACLPEELHGLGVQMVALEIATAGRKVVVLGPQSPVEEIVSTAASLDAAAVGLSVSSFAPRRRTEEDVRALRAELPERVDLWVGGRGAQSLEAVPPAVRRFGTLDEVAEAVRALPD
jgi:methanogenic corrinoid protein MtbC1